MEPYLYTGNNPIMFTDPTGMSKDGVDGPGKGFLGDLVWVGAGVVRTVFNAYSTYKKEGLGGFALHGSNRLATGDQKLIRQNGNRNTQWIDASGLLDNPFTPGGPNVSKSTSGTFTKKSEALLNQARKFVEGISDGKKIEDGMNSADKLNSSQQGKGTFKLNVIDSIDFGNNEIIDKEIDVTFKYNSYLDLKKKTDSLREINNKEVKERENWRNEFTNK